MAQGRCHGRVVPIRFSWGDLLSKWDLTDITSHKY
jgi:hypothetical protein